MVITVLVEVLVHTGARDIGDYMFGMISVKVSLAINYHEKSNWQLSSSEILQLFTSRPLNEDMHI